VKHFRSVSRMIENRVLCGAMILLGMSGILSAQAGQVQEQTYRQLTAAHPDWVQVPGQIMRADCVHEIPNGAKVVIGENGEPTGDVLLKGQVIAHHDTCSEAPISTKHTASVNKPGHTPGPPFNGWVEDSQESVSLGSSDNIDWESGEFYVPNAPSSNGGTIFLFNGIAPTAQNWILQPVLQYGVSAAGGGNYWNGSIAEVIAYRCTQECIGHSQRRSRCQRIRRVALARVVNAPEKIKGRGSALDGMQAQTSA